MMKTYSRDEFFRIPDLPLWVQYGRQQAEIAEHNHDFLEIVFVAQGYAVHNIVSRGVRQTYGLIQGDVFSVMQDELHGYENGRNLAIYNIGLTREFVAAELAGMQEIRSWQTLFERSTDKVHLPLNDREAAENCLKKIIQECSLCKPGFKFYARAAMIEFLLIVGRVDPTTHQASVEAASGILETIRLMEKSPEKPLPLAYLAKNAAMSVSHYTKKFREATGTSPLSYLINLRLEKARGLLEETVLPIAEIALQCGFCDSNYMIKHFRLRHGITPARYRSLLRKQLRIKN